MAKSVQPSEDPSKVFNRAEIDERKCQQQMCTLDRQHGGLDVGGGYQLAG